MANFSLSMNLDEVFPKGMEDKNLALNMIKAGQEIVLPAIRAGAEKHIVTGHMAKSLKATKPVINKDGDAVGRIKFYGSDGSKRSKRGQRFDRTNWIKAFRIEYGTVRQKAEPFIRPAIKSCESKAMSAMQKVFDQATKK